jgi:hypothetical protein
MGFVLVRMLSLPPSVTNIGISVGFCSCWVFTGCSNPHFPIQHVVGDPALRFMTWRRNRSMARNFASRWCSPQPLGLSLCRVLTGEHWNFPQAICIARLRSWCVLYYSPEEVGFVPCTRITPLRSFLRIGVVIVSGGLCDIRLCMGCYVSSDVRPTKYCRLS